MIQSLHVQNFQSHKDTFIEFGNNVNIFIGYSDSGKTAIIRALRWVITNKPSGDAFRSNWGGETSVELTLINGTRVKRTKGNSTNEYELQIKGSDLLVFKAFGTEVPVEIEKALSFDSINVQEQLDAPYLFSETPGQVAKHFNKIAKLEKIDVGIARVQSDITKLTDSIKTNTSNIVAYKESLKKWDFLQEFEEKLEVLESKVKTKEELVSKRKTLISLYKSLEEVVEEQATYKDLLKHEEAVTTLLSHFAKNKSNKQALQALKRLISSIDSNSKQQESLQNVLSSETIVNKLLQLYKERKELEKECISFMNLTNSINNLRTKQENMLKSLEILEAEYKRDFPPTCPLCGTKIK